MRRKVLPTFASICLCLAAGLGFAGTALGGGNESMPQDRINLIVSHLPLKTSRAYHALRRAAGNPAGEILPMTKSEMWSLERENFAAFIASAKKVGVKFEEIRSGDTDALLPMAATQKMTPKQSEMMHETMQDRATMGFSMMSLNDPATLEYALTREMSAQEKPASIKLKLSDTVTLTARRTDLIRNADSYVWHGEVEGTGEPVTLVFWPEGRLSGTIEHDGTIYRVQSMGDRLHGVIETMPRMLPPEHAPMGDTMQKKLNMKDDPLASRGDATPVLQDMQKSSEPIEHQRDLAPVGKDGAPARAPDIVGSSASAEARNAPPLTITLIVAYTKAAARHYSNIIKDLVTLAVAETNQSFRISGIGNLSVKVVYVYETDYVEKGTHFDHMIQYADKGDGIADEIHGLRNKYRADIAVMIVDDANGCGLSAGISPPEDRAFAVVHHGCAATTYSLAHEIGHIIGARHDMGYDDNKTPFAYGHGFVNGTKWRTMMSYEQSCGGCPRVPVWSNPELRLRGEPAGAELSNNSRAIREGAKRVADFR